VKEKSNIFEELNKMKNLIKTKRGVVISEQDMGDMAADVGEMMRQVSYNNSDEQKMVDIVKKYTDIENLKTFMRLYQKTSGHDFGLDLYSAINTNDPKEWGELYTHLGTMGITMGGVSAGDGRGTFKWVFKDSDGNELPGSPMASAQTQRQFAQGMSRGGAFGFQDYPIVDCTGYFKIPELPPTAALQKEFQKASGLELDKEENKKFYCSADYMNSYLKKGGTTKKTPQGNPNGGNTSNSYSKIVSDGSKTIQASLGTQQSGQLSDDELNQILSQLNGESQGNVELPIGSDGQLDLQKILTSL
jgi:hypothetical protein